MPKTWTKTEAFEFFGTKLTNARWSWSAASPSGDVVAIVLWQDAVMGKNGDLTYSDEMDLDAEWRKRPGHAERNRHLALSRDRLGGQFRAVIARAVDTTADPRKIAGCFPQEQAMWRLVSFDESTGAFTAEVIKN